MEKSLKDQMDEVERQRQALDAQIAREEEKSKLWYGSVIPKKFTTIQDCENEIAAAEKRLRELEK